MRRKIINVKKILITCLIIFFLYSACAPSKGSIDYSRVMPASKNQINQISLGLEKGILVSECYAIKSNAFEKAYFVAGHLSGPGVIEAVGVWSITGDPDTPGMVLCTNKIAKKFSVYPLGSSTKANITMADEGADLVHSYVQNKVYLE